MISLSLYFPLCGASEGDAEVFAAAAMPGFLEVGEVDDEVVEIENPVAGFSFSVVVDANVLACPSCPIVSTNCCHV